ncbi:MAG: alanine racemase, partial [Nitrospirae bacterium]
VHLREHGIKDTPIMVLFQSEPFKELVDYELTPVVHSFDTLKRLSDFAKSINRPIPVHINIDTGMGRMGIPYEKVVHDPHQLIGSAHNIQIEGVMSHFSDADSPDTEFTMIQLERFREVVDMLRKSGLNFISHIANSAAILRYEEACLDAVRPGLMLYGGDPFVNSGLEPAMTVKTGILDVRRLGRGTPVSYGRTFYTMRESVVGVVPVGYADGLHRAGSNRLEFLVKGKRVPVIGRICMDLTMIDLTEIDDVTPGEEVVIIGKQGGEEIRVEEFAERIGTIPYEVMTSFGYMKSKSFSGIPGDEV